MFIELVLCLYIYIYFFFDKRNKQLKTMLDRQGSVEQVGAELAHIGAGTIYTQLSRTSLEM